MRRRPWILILLITGVVLDLIVSLALGYVVVQANRAASQAHIVKLAAYEFCINNNKEKAQDLKRWNDVLSLLHDGKRDAALNEFIAGVRKANLTADQPNNCARVQP